MPEGQKEPDEIPQFILNNLIYSVPHESDDDFSTKRLACIKHAKKIYKELLNVEKTIA